MPSIGLPVLMPYYLEIKVTTQKSASQFYFNNSVKFRHQLNLDSRNRFPADAIPSVAACLVILCF